MFYNINMEEKRKVGSKLYITILFLLVIHINTVSYGPNLLINSGF